MEATARGLFVHQIIGIVPQRAREVYEIPKASEAWTALAIGYLGDPTQLPESLRERDMTPRQRKPQREFVFGGWGKVSSIVS